MTYPENIWMLVLMLIISQVVSILIILFYRQRCDREKEIRQKIREIEREIEEYRDSLPWENNSLMKWEAINHILEQVIDKHKGESEAEE